MNFPQIEFVDGPTTFSASETWYGDIFEACVLDKHYMGYEVTVIELQYEWRYLSDYEYEDTRVYIKGKHKLSDIFCLYVTSQSSNGEKFLDCILKTSEQKGRENLKNNLKELLGIDK